LPAPRLHAASPSLAAGFARVRSDLALPVGFPAEVLAEAAASVDRAQELVATLPDRRDIPFVTIDPAGATDLDQALAIEARPGGGYTVHYAIADVSTFVPPGGAVDTEARHRGVTVYLPDGRVPLHPPVISEGAASLLPGMERPALLWTLTLDSGASLTDACVERAIVRSRRAYGYVEAQHLLDNGEADDVLVLLRELGRRRLDLEVARGGVSLDLPEQEAVDVDGHLELRLRAALDVESWNAQISLMTGMAAARLMLDGNIGVLRTLPPPDDRDLDRLRVAAGALGCPWDSDEPYGGFVRRLDSADPRGASLLLLAARTLRGAGYESFDGTAPEGATHAAVAAPYAHVTAPLRRLVDRFGNEIVLSLSAGRSVPEWVREALPDLPKLMGDARRREGAATRAALDVLESAELAEHLGETLEAVVVAADPKGSTLQLVEPAVQTRVPVTLELSATVRVRVDAVDVTAAESTLTVL
jgi:exoribonuclease R